MIGEYHTRGILFVWVITGSIPLVWLGRPSNVIPRGAEAEGPLSVSVTVYQARLYYP